MSPRRYILPLLLLLVPAARLVSAEDRPPMPNVESIIQRMAQARADNRVMLRAYSVTRNYTLVGKDKKEAKAEVLTQITFVPPSAKKFVIQKASGTGFAERAVRQMLEHETEIVKNHDDTELSFANYDFRLLRDELCGAQRCFVLAITPKRKDKALLVGQVWVDTATYLPHRTEGKPAKGVSWWLRDSSIIFTYGEVEGMWLQTASESTSNVRFVGRYTMFSRDLQYVLSRPAESDGSRNRRRLSAVALCLLPEE